jgi:hypothetical protein
MLDRVLNRLRLEWIRWHLRRALQGIYATAPVTPGHRPFTALSMVQHKDVAAYLVAIKSFTHFLQPEKIVIICDPSITPDDEKLLVQHIPHATLHRVEVFRHPQLPVGGCWERLHAVATYAANDYVIQLDADTVTLTALPEVEAAIQSRIGFVLNGFLPGDEDDDEPATCISSIERASKYAQRWPTIHIQALAEQQLSHAGLNLNRRNYVRGCAGFTGFPPDPSLVGHLVEFSDRMRQRLGPRWSEWGTEQVASNYLVANAAGTRLLPMPKYSASGPSLDDHAFLHFIGPTRFINRNYEKAVRRAIQLITHPPVIAG